MHPLQVSCQPAVPSGTVATHALCLYLQKHLSPAPARCWAQANCQSRAYFYFIFCSVMIEVLWCLALAGCICMQVVPKSLAPFLPDDGAGDGDVARAVLGDAVHGGAADPAPGGRVAGLRAGQRTQARRRVRLRGGGRQGGARGVQGAGAPRRHPRGDPGAGRRVHPVQPHPHRLASSLLTSSAAGMYPPPCGRLPLLLQRVRVQCSLARRVACSTGLLTELKPDV